jgi:hypothetical protein
MSVPRLEAGVTVMPRGKSMSLNQPSLQRALLASAHFVVSP